MWKWEDTKIGKIEAGRVEHQEQSWAGHIEDQKIGHWFQKGTGLYWPFVGHVRWECFLQVPGDTYNRGPIQQSWWKMAWQRLHFLWALWRNHLGEKLLGFFSLITVSPCGLLLVQQLTGRLCREYLGLQRRSSAAQSSAHLHRHLPPWPAALEPITIREEARVSEKQN